MNIENVKDQLVVRDADLSGSQFTDVSLAGATFKNASLAGAIMADVDLTGASIADANLTGMTLDSVAVSDLLRAFRDAARAYAVVYALDVARLQAFYQQLAGLRVAHAESDHVVLAGGALELTIVRIPPAIAATIENASPARPRTGTAIKLAFEVPDLAAARVLAPALGGQLYTPEREWQSATHRVCDALDPEGNVVQFRQRRLRMSPGL